jgi:hypothetical protein
MSTPIFWWLLLNNLRILETCFEKMSRTFLIQIGSLGSKTVTNFANVFNCKYGTKFIDAVAT